VIYLNPGVNPNDFFNSPGMDNIPIFPFNPVVVPQDAGGGTLLPFRTTQEGKDAIDKAIQKDRRVGFFDFDWPRKMEAPWERENFVEPDEAGYLQP
jgi:hypothetical protein